MTIAMRIEQMFRAAQRAGAETDWLPYDVGRDPAAALVELVAGQGPAAALELLGEDPRWDTLKAYLQGLVDASEAAADPTLDPSYQAHLDDAARHCRCCSACTRVPCDGCAAGGVCDQTCHCGDLDDEFGWVDEDDDIDADGQRRADRWPED